ncbi:MAG: hypothetical protein RL358_452 [Pseudomonadota bacterium]
MARKQLEIFAEDFRRLLSADDESIKPEYVASQIALSSRMGKKLELCQVKSEIEIGELCALLAWRSDKESGYCVAFRDAARAVFGVAAIEAAMAQQISQSRSEWFNGQGIPAKLSGEQIPLCARIYALVEYVLPLIDPRSSSSKNGPPFTFYEVQELLRRVSGRQFDPVLIEHLLPEIRRLMGLSLIC